MKHFLFLIGILTVLSQIHADCLTEVLKAKPHDTRDICTSQLNWALLPHPHDCNKFYVCANYVPEEFQCDENYYYDTTQRRCVLGSCSEIEKCEEGWVRRVEGECNAFEICRDGNYIRAYCPKDTYFIEELAICAQVSDTPQHKCSCILPAYSVLKNVDDCETFYICIDGQAVLEQCQPGTYFNSYLSACVVDVHGVCLKTTVHTTMSPEENAVLEICDRRTLSDSDDTDRSGPPIFLPNDDMDCRKFYMCANDRVFTKYCPIGFYYNRELHFCEVDTDGSACQAIREQIEKKKEEEEKESAVKEDKKPSQQSNDIEPESEPKPVKLSVSMTHVKLDVEKNNNGNIKHVEESSTAVHAKPAKEFNENESVAGVPVPPIMAPNIFGQLEEEEESNAAAIHAVSTKELIESEPVNIVVPPSIMVSNILEHVGDKEKKSEKDIDEEEMANNSAEVEESNTIEMKLPLSELKLPVNPHYDKLASKFMSF